MNCSNKCVGSLLPFTLSSDETKHMKCINPILVRRFKSVTTEEQRVILIHAYNDGVHIPGYHYVPCGKCIACRITERNKWTSRLLEVFNESKNCYFITLTYDDAHCMLLPKVKEDTPIEDCYPSLHREHLEQFVRKLKVDTNKIANQLLKQKGVSYKERRKYRHPFKYFAVGDYGEQTVRPHYHIVIFNSLLDAKRLAEYISKNWQYGVQNDVQDLIPERCAYICKYVSLLPKTENYYKSLNIDLPFRIVSRGINPSSKRCEILADEYNRGYKYVQHGKAKYSYANYTKQKIIDTMDYYHATKKYEKYYKKLTKNNRGQMRPYQSEIYNDYLNSKEYQNYKKDCDDFKGKLPDEQEKILRIKELTLEHSLNKK